MLSANLHGAHVLVELLYSLLHMREALARCVVRCAFGIVQRGHQMDFTLVSVISVFFDIFDIFVLSLRPARPCLFFHSQFPSSSTLTRSLASLLPSSSTEETDPVEDQSCPPLDQACAGTRRARQLQIHQGVPPARRVGESDPDSVTLSATGSCAMTDCCCGRGW